MCSRDAGTRRNMHDDDKVCLYFTVTDIYVYFSIGLLPVVTAALILVINNMNRTIKSLLWLVYYYLFVE